MELTIKVKYELDEAKMNITIKEVTVDGEEARFLDTMTRGEHGMYIIPCSTEDMGEGLGLLHYEQV